MEIVQWKVESVKHGVILFYLSNTEHNMQHLSYNLCQFLSSSDDFIYLVSTWNKPIIKNKM